MATPIHLSQPPIMIDVVQLVATIALASETLAAAAEALAEAARALMEMSQDYAGSQPAGVHSPTHLADQGGSKVDIDQGRVDQHVQASQLKDSRAEKGAPSLSKVALDPDDKPAASSSQSRVQIPGYTAPPGHETNNKFDTLPVSPPSNQPPAAASTSAHIHPQSLKPQQNDPGPVPRPIAKTDPPSQTYVPHEPSGPGTLVRRINFPRRYLIRSDQESAGVPFMAYTALQNKKLVCIIADKESMMALYATALGDITQYRVFRPVTPHCVRIIDPTVQSFIKHASPAILLLSPDQPLEIHEISLHIDSIVYWPCAWGIPLETGTFISRFLSRSTLAISYYLLLTTTLKFDPKPYGLVEYPAELIEMILQPGSLFNRVCEAAGPVMNRLELRWTKPTFVLPPGTGFASSTPHINTPRGPSLAPYSRRGFQVMPPGHYYIIIPQKSDLILLISYIALNSQKVMCYISDSNVLESHQKHVNTIADVNSIAGKQNILNGINQLKNSQYGILLRSTMGNPDQYFTRGLVNGLIYVGAPLNPNHYVKTLVSKVSHSYLILTDAERMILPRISVTPSLREHPFLHNLNGSVVGPVINELRVRLPSGLRGQ